ncbi:hypothetical protein G7Y89_g8621 [Cudoniella acicularis]|uniref:Uncharacterized protein n=1 Tax=Cudoniella acicularis TaxID=354080 RepID=A0A8H4RG96_9HELO|nr:hypothetical protein G7Y89_g8621 [Cudoniella acicularis]
MPSFLDLPRELRDKILSLAISAPIPAPESHSATGDGDRVELSNTEFTGYAKHDGVKYRKQMNRTIFIPTLLVNRQLHEETLTAIARLSTKHTYILDIMLVDGYFLWPTWLSVPTLSSMVDKVHTSIRNDHTSKRVYSGFAGGSGGPPIVVWPLLGILDRFLRVGPVVNPAAKAHGTMAIGVLELDVITPEVAENLFIPHEGCWDTLRKHGWSENESDVKYIIPASYLVAFLEEHLDRLLSMGGEHSDYGRLLIERIGTVRLMLDGVLYHEWNMAQVLACVRFSESFSSYPGFSRGNLAKFKEWKLEAYQIRAQLGLPTIPSQDGTPTDNVA